MSAMKPSITIPTVTIISGSEEIRTSLQQVLRSRGMTSSSARSAAEYLRLPTPSAPSCLIVDMDLPDMSGLEFQQQVATTHAPVIIVSRLVEIRKSVLCMRAGAIDFLPLPVDASALFGAVEIALDLDRRTRARRLLCATLHQRLSSLTRREREVAALVVRGLMNKHIAAELGISLVTVQIHRGNIMRKMKAQSLADLVHMAHLTGFLADLAEHPSLALGLSAARAQSTVSLLTPHPAT